LELGGKSPVIVDKSADLKKTAQYFLGKICQQWPNLYCP